MFKKLEEWLNILIRVMKDTKKTQIELLEVRATICVLKINCERN